MLKVEKDAEECYICYAKETKIRTVSKFLDPDDAVISVDVPICPSCLMNEIEGAIFATDDPLAEDDEFMTELRELFKEFGA